MTFSIQKLLLLIISARTVDLTVSQVPNNYYYVGGTTVGEWGGICRCPNGEEFEVGDNYDSCGSLACVGGTVVVPCGQGVISSGSGYKVECGDPDAPFSPTPAPVQPGDATVTVAVQNLFWWNLFNQRNGADFYNQFRSYGPYDIMLFQECDNVWQIVNGLGYSNWEAYSGSKAVTLAWDASRFTKVKQGVKDVSEDEREQYYGYRGISYVRLYDKLTSGYLLAVSHHGPLRVNTGGKPGGYQTATNIKNAIYEQLESGDTLILGGDFNSEVWHTTIVELKKHFTIHASDWVDHVFSNSVNLAPNPQVTVIPKSKTGSDHNGLKLTFQLYEAGGGAQPTPAPVPVVVSNNNCLCIFDIDRTLTAAQQTNSQDCPGSATINGIEDVAYSGGTLRASSMTAAFQSTLCAQNCYMAIISTGLPNVQEREWIVNTLWNNVQKSALLGLTNPNENDLFKYFDSRAYKTAPFWLGWPSGQKQNAVEDHILPWFSTRGVSFNKILFLDDRQDNTNGFIGTSYFSGLVSKSSRDPASTGRGWCGATVLEANDYYERYIESNPNSLPECVGPYPSHPECEGRIQWMLDNWDSQAWTQYYIDAGVDGSRCSIQIYLHFSESVEYCPNCACPTTSSTPAPNTATLSPSIDGERVLVWEDNFDTLDLSKWERLEIPPYTYNNERQRYTSSDLNSFVQNGKLVIRAMQTNGEYTSARLSSAFKGDWLYGRIEARAKLPLGNGLWPAIWMLPTDWEYGGWPQSGEIDIMEHVSCDIGKVHASVHTGAYNHLKNTQRSAKTNIDANAYHVYAIEWSESKIEGFVDNEKYFEFKNDFNGDSATWPFSKRFHLVLNTAIGGDWGGYCLNGASPNLPQPSDFYIDWIRVYAPLTLTSTCTEIGEDPWAEGDLTGRKNPCCEGLQECLQNWDGDSNYFYKCVEPGHCDDRSITASPLPSPTPSPTLCTGENVDPWSTGSEVDCCAGLTRCLKNWNNDGNFFSKCIAGSCETSGPDPNENIQICGKGPFTEYPECESRIDWMVRNWDRERNMQNYRDLGVDGSVCSIQQYLYTHESTDYCPKCICSEDDSESDSKSSESSGLIVALASTAFLIAGVVLGGIFLWQRIRKNRSSSRPSSLDVPVKFRNQTYANDYANAYSNNPPNVANAYSNNPPNVANAYSNNPPNVAYVFNPAHKMDGYI